MPNVLHIPQVANISSTVYGRTDDPSVQNFLTLAFGENYTEKLAPLDSVRKRTEVRAANIRINQLLSEFLPNDLRLEFVIDLLSDDPLQFSLNFRDIYSGDTPIHMRGGGIQRIVTLMICYSESTDPMDSILSFLPMNRKLHYTRNPNIFLEHSLEKLGMNPFIQVIYATHSPSMINSMKPHSLRLLRRTQLDGKATAVVSNRPIGDDFLPVRASLGLTPSDSLLYAPGYDCG